MSRMARSGWPFRRSRKAIGKRIANSSMASASRCRSRWGAAIKIAPNAAMMASSDPLDTHLASSSLIISDRKERVRDASSLNWVKKRDGEQRNLPGTRNVLSRYAGEGRGPCPSPRCRRDYGVAAGIPPASFAAFTRRDCEEASVERDGCCHCAGACCGGLGANRFTDDAVSSLHRASCISADETEY